MYKVYIKFIVFKIICGLSVLICFRFDYKSFLFNEFVVYGYEFVMLWICICL